MENSCLVILATLKPLKRPSMNHCYNFASDSSCDLSGVKEMDVKDSVDVVNFHSKADFVRLRRHFVESEIKRLNEPCP
jgi:hypothetical protein